MSASLRQIRFRLFVADHAQNGALAIANLSAICREHLPGRDETEIIDVLQEPELALAEGIFITPTLLQLAPYPPRRIVGTLSNTQTVLLALGLGTPVA